jgi:hypothetical protein
MFENKLKPSIEPLEQIMYAGETVKKGTSLDVLERFFFIRKHSTLFS